MNEKFMKKLDKIDIKTIYLKNKKEKIERKYLKSLFNKLTVEQKILFDRIYSVSVDKISYKKISWAIIQCEDTIYKNKEERWMWFNKIK